jgi:P-loop containing NTP hydrolase pore-1/C-terminal domain on Strawberry notch homologue
MAKPNFFDDLVSKNMTNLAAIESFKQLLIAGEKLDTKTISSVMNYVTGGTAAEGRWQMKTATDLVEGAVASCIKDIGVNPQKLAELQQLLIAQTVRSDDQVNLQQFSTPPSIGSIMATAAHVTADDIFLEPSAGTGMLAAFAAHASCQQIILNEFSPARAKILGHLFGEDHLYKFDAENLNDYLPKRYKPTVVIANPPFSVSPNLTKRNKDAIVRHFRAAMLRLRPNGRLVLLGPHWLMPDKFTILEEFGTVILSAKINGDEYRRYGTTMPTRLLVIEKAILPGVQRLDVDTTLPNLMKVAQQLPPRLPIQEAADRQEEPITDFFTDLPLFQLGSIIAKAAPVVQQVISVVQKAIAPSWLELVKLTYSPTPAKSAELSDQLYESYSSCPIEIEGAMPHPTPLVESAAMSSVSMPQPEYQPLLPAEVLAKGLLSHAQLESLIFAGQAHSKMLNGRWEYNDKAKRLDQTGSDTGTEYRQGFFLGDGTGAGKGRQVAGIILDNWLQGRTKALWVSKNFTLIEDARRDWVALGGQSEQIIDLSKYAQGEAINCTEGILFVAYATLRTIAKGNKASRLDQIINWIGGDTFDGCICFDESHLMGNAIGEDSGRGIKAASQQGMAGIDLQNRLPQARVVYVSATGASKVSSLAYAPRLGLWQTTDFPFKSREDFISSMEDGGIAATEVIIHNLKAHGVYLARALSYQGVGYETLVHQLTPAQMESYDAFAAVFEQIHTNIERALAATNVVNLSGKCINGQAKSAAMSAFEGAKQRFFQHLINAAKVPTVIKAIEQDIVNGYAAVLQIVSTDEALLNRRLDGISPSEWGDLRLDFTPKEAIIQYLEGSFPTKLHSICEIEGREVAMLIDGLDGKPIYSQEAIELRDVLVERIADLPSIAGFLDQLVWHFGTEAIAEVTGRSKRVVLKDNQYKLESRSATANSAETSAFQNDRKQILLFSGAGGTGRSYHAAMDVQNQRLRRHYLVQPGWQASEAVQSLGRTHRSAQAQPPVFVLVTTNVRGEIRFTSTIAKRLDSLGALTKGQRQTGGQNMFDADVANLTSAYAKAALADFCKAMTIFGIGDISCADFERSTGLSLTNSEGDLKEIPINTFLNRLLALSIDNQNLLFEDFEQRLHLKVRQAKEAGHYETGLETLKSDGGFRVISEQPLISHANGSQTVCYEIEGLYKPEKRSVHSAQFICEQEGSTCLIRNGEVAIVRRHEQIADVDGSLAVRCSLERPSGASNVTEKKIARDGWESTIASDDFWQRWVMELAEMPEFLPRKHYLVSGMLLSIWHKIPSDSIPRIFRLQTIDGQVLLGRSIRPKQVAKLLAQFDIKTVCSPAQIQQMVLDDSTVDVGRYQLGLSRVRGESRIEVLNHSDSDNIQWLLVAGCFKEIINYRSRIFVPVSSEGAETIGRLQAG